jgi:hypothetical protein
MTTKDITVAHVFPALKAQAARLNRISDEASKKLVTMEQLLVELNIGVEFWYSEPILKDDAVGTLSKDATSEQLVQILGFTRLNEKWCLAVKPIRLVDGFFENDISAPFRNKYSGGDVVPLLQQSRDFRLAAIRVMPDFIHEFSTYIAKAADLIEKEIA